MSAPVPPLELHDDELVPVVMLLASRATVALTGAGISTESGIPGYRGEGARSRTRPPLRIQELTADEEGQRRYWARAHIGWPTLWRAAPNGAHRALARLEQRGALRGVITQNVDGLHRRAGSHRVVELHGALAQVSCLGCGAVEDRAAVHLRLEEANPGFSSRISRLLPDGDSELDDDDIARFRLVRCLACDGALRPLVVFFGERVPEDRALAARALIDEATALLVVGSTLEVDSAKKLLRRARERGVPVVVINRGPTRADPFATLRLEARAGDVLPRLAAALAGA